MALGVQNELEQKLIEFCYKNTMVIANTSSNNTRDDSTHGYHQMVNTKIRLYSLKPKMEKQKQDQELTVAQIMSSLLKTSGLN